MQGVARTETYGELSGTAARSALGGSRAHRRSARRIPGASGGARRLRRCDLHGDHAARRPVARGRRADLPDKSPRRLRGGCATRPPSGPRRRARHPGLELPDPQPQRDRDPRDPGRGGRRLAPIRERRLPADRSRRRDDPRRRPDARAVPHRARAAGAANVALAHRHRGGPARRRRRRRRVPRHEAPPAHGRLDRPGCDPRLRRQGRHPQGPPLERRASERRLVADASARRLQAFPPLRHRPRRHPPEHADGHRDGRHLRLRHEADRRAGERSPGRPRHGDRKRDGEHRRLRLDGDHLRHRGEPGDPGQLLQDRGRLGARVVLLHVDGLPGGRRDRDRLLRRQVELGLRRHQRRREREQHHDGDGEQRHDDRERRHRPRVLREREQLDLHTAGRLERARRRRHDRDQRLDGRQDPGDGRSDRQRKRDLDGLRARVRAPGGLQGRQRRTRA